MLILTLSTVFQLLQICDGQHPARNVHIFSYISQNTAGQVGKGNNALIVPINLLMKTRQFQELMFHPCSCFITLFLKINKHSMYPFNGKVNMVKSHFDHIDFVSLYQDWWMKDITTVLDPLNLWYSFFFWAIQ